MKSGAIHTPEKQRNQYVYNYDHTYIYLSIYTCAHISKSICNWYTEPVACRNSFELKAKLPTTTARPVILCGDSGADH